MTHSHLVWHSHSHFFVVVYGHLDDVQGWTRGLTKYNGPCAKQFQYGGHYNFLLVILNRN
jgi:hypothetical protein